LKSRFSKARQRTAPNWTALGYTADESRAINEQTAWQIARESLRDHDIGRRRFLRRSCLLPLDLLRGLPRANDDAQKAGTYFLWYGPALAYVGESVCVIQRIRQHRDQRRIPFTHATWLRFSVDWHRKDTESMHVRAYSPPYNRTNHG
jgi:hypothetical protein